MAGAFLQATDCISQKGGWSTRLIFLWSRGERIIFFFNFGDLLMAKKKQERKNLQNLTSEYFLSVERR